MTFLSEYEKELERSSDIQGHLKFLFSNALRYLTVVELGVRFGSSTVAFLAAMEQNGGHLWSVDNETPQTPLSWLSSSLWTFIQGDDIDSKVLEVLPENIDMLLIDTSHTFDHTLKELKTYSPRINRGGLIALHDTDDQGVTEALNHFCASQHIAWMNYPHSYGLGVIDR